MPNFPERVAAVTVCLLCVFAARLVSLGLPPFPASSGFVVAAISRIVMAAIPRGAAVVVAIPRTVLMAAITRRPTRSLYRQ